MTANNTLTFMDRFTCVRDDMGGAFVACTGLTAYADVCQMQCSIAQKNRLTAHVIARPKAAAIHSTFNVNN